MVSSQSASRRSFNVLQVVEVVEVLNNELHDLRVIAAIIRILGVILDGFELDNTTVTLLLPVNTMKDAFAVG